MRRGWWLMGLLGLAPVALAQNPRWIMGKGNSFSRLEERLELRAGGPRLARARTRPGLPEPAGAVFLEPLGSRLLRARAPILDLEPFLKVPFKSFNNR